MYDADNVKLLNSHDQEFMLNNVAGIWKQSALEKAEEPYPEPKIRTVMVSWAWTYLSWHQDV
jgi:hypothetical protein